jgi:uncharacterized protein
MRQGQFPVVISTLALCLSGLGTACEPKAPQDSGSESASETKPSSVSDLAASRDTKNGAAGEVSTKDARLVAEKLLENLIMKRWKSSEELFNQAMKEAMPASQLQITWQTALEGLGTYQTLQEPTVDTFEGGRILKYKMDYARGHLSIKVVISPEKQIVGLWIFPTVTKESPNPKAVASDFEEAGLKVIQMEIGMDGWMVPGTLVLPKSSDKSTAVIMVHGSGPLDRDATIGPNQPFRQLALELGKRGIASFRYDKRTLTHKKKVGLLSNFTVEHETIDDAKSAFTAVQKHEAIHSDRVYILGHSLGGMLLPRIAEGLPSVSGLIAMAASPRSPEDLILEQIQYLANIPTTGVTPEKRKAVEEQALMIKALKAGTLSKKQSDMPFGIPVSYWLDLKQYDPIKTATQLKAPMLFLQGGRDYQVSLQDLALWEKGLGKKSGHMFRNYPGLNHLFQEGNQPSTPADYMQKKEIPSYVFDDIASFIKQKRSAPKTR